MKSILTLVITVFLFGQIKSQSIHIGDSADRVLKLIEWSTNNEYGYDSYGNTKGNNVTWDAEYFDGRITQVMQCYYQQYLIDLKFTASFCVYYIIEQNRLDRVQTVFEDVSLKILLSSYHELYGERNIGDYFFSDDYSYYSIIYLNNNGHATSEYRKLNPDLIPKEIKDSIQMKIELKEQEKVAAMEFCQSLRKKAIVLSEYDSLIYINAFNTLVDDIKNHLNYKLIGSMSTSYSQHCSKKANNYRFKNTYLVSYNQVNNSIEYLSGKKYFSSDSTFNQIHTSLIEGVDSNCVLFKSIELNLPKIQVKGCEVLSRAIFQPLIIDYSRGKTVVTLNKKGIKFGFKKPDLDIQSILRKEIGERPFGRYTLEYVVILVNDKEIVKTNLYNN